MAAIRLNIGIDDVAGDDFEKGRKVLAAILDLLPKTGGFIALKNGDYVSGFSFDVNPETMDVRSSSAPRLEGFKTVTLSIDEL